MSGILSGGLAGRARALDNEIPRPVGVVVRPADRAMRPAGGVCATELLVLELTHRVHLLSAPEHFSNRICDIPQPYSLRT